MSNLHRSLLLGHLVWCACLVACGVSAEMVPGASAEFPPAPDVAPRRPELPASQAAQDAASSATVSEDADGRDARPVAADVPVGPAPTRPAAPQGLRRLPENPRYLEWKGLPFFWVQSTQHTASDLSANASVGAGGDSDARRFFCDDAAGAETAVKAAPQYQAMAATAARFLAADTILPIVFFHDPWCVGTESDELITRAIKATWNYPNVAYGFRTSGSTPERWMQRFRELGRQHNPAVNHLFVSNVPTDAHVDLLLGRGTTGVPLIPEPSDLKREQRPLVRNSVEAGCLCMDGRKCSFDPQRCRATATGPTAQLMRRQVAAGLHTGQPTGVISPDYQAYLLQIRWYVENVRGWSDEPGDEISDEKLPRFVPSQRPRLDNPAGFTSGVRAAAAREIEWSVVYRDADGDPPAQAEVWLDRNGDGRFAPDPAAGERVAMMPAGADFTAGVTYTVSLAAPDLRTLRYLFRFADRHWYPPVGAGVLKPHPFGGYGYDAFSLTLPVAGAGERK